MKYYTYNGTKVRLSKEEYRINGTLAVAMYTQNGELYDVINRQLNGQNAVRQYGVPRRKQPSGYWKLAPETRTCSAHVLHTAKWLC